ncbi:MAG: c-type cytochrome [Chloroflexi bacterium]|jgi:mono/diheme cytochrome c family protein|nr:c-type cytochrome [Chloroflexota bacterium]
MKTNRIEILIGMIATLLIGTGLLLYALQEPQRLVVAQAAQEQADIDEAITIYAENCTICHGMAGEGIGSNPPLDNEGLRATDAETLFKIISRGLFGTSMPAWNQEDGGPLSDYQVGQLVSLVQAVDWQAVQDRVVNLGLVPRIPFAAEPDPEVLALLAEMPGGETLALGITVYAQECVACHGADGVGTALAPALNDPLVSEKTWEELERIVRSGVSGTLMASWENALEDEEISAVLTLLTEWDQVPAGAIPAPEVGPIPVTAESLALGESLFATSCSFCHGPEGQGTQRAPSLNVKGFLEDTNDQALQQIITLGVSDTSMPAWGDRLTEAEIQAIVGFIRAWEPNAPEVAEPARTGGGPWWQTEGDTNPGQSGQGGRGGQGRGGSNTANENTAAAATDAENAATGNGNSNNENGNNGNGRGGAWWQQDETQPPGQQQQQDTVAQADAMSQSETPVTEPQVAPDATQQAAAMLDQAHEDGQGGPPEWAGQESGAAGNEQGHVDGEIPLFLLPDEQPLSWSERMDARAWLIAATAVIVPAFLLVVGLLGMIRMGVFSRRTRVV